MPIPCYATTCSVELTQDPLTGELIANLITDPDGLGSLACDPAEGVYVKVAGLGPNQVGHNEFDGDGVQAAAVQCGQALARASDGSLFTIPEGAMNGLVSDVLANPALNPGIGEEVAGIGSVGTFNDHQTVNGSVFRRVQVTNPFDCTAWCLFSLGQFKIIGRRSGSAPSVDPIVASDPDHDAQAYYITGHTRIEVESNPDAPIISDRWTPSSNRFDLAGYWAGSEGIQSFQRDFHHHALFQMGAGKSTTVLSRVTVVSKYHFDMSAETPLDEIGDTGFYLGDDNRGISILHPTALWWRLDGHP